MTSAPFGQTPAGPVRRHTIGAEPGLVVDVLDLGATLSGVHVTVGAERRNLVLDLPSAQAYLDSPDYVGAVVGRYANRIGRGHAELDGTELHLAVNEGRNQLHGGPDGFDRRIWAVAEHTADRITLTLVSPDGDQGYPGELTATATYAVTADTLTLELTATTDAPTYASLTTHAYWNLDGAATIDDHVLTVAARTYLPVDDELIPTGEQRQVHDALDLRRPARLEGREIDHCLALEDKAPHATMSAGGITVELTTDAPGLQVYTGDKYKPQRRGLALEPQLFPDAPHHQDFPSAVLRPGETFRSVSRWRVTAR